MIEGEAGLVHMVGKHDPGYYRVLNLVFFLLKEKGV